jgi:glutamyl-tRNA synthetase
VVFQGANLPRHQEDARRILEEGHGYRCFCTPAELAEQRREAEARHESFKYDRRCANLAPVEVARRVADGMPFVIRFRVPEGTTEWDDVVHGRIAFPNKDIEDFVVLRSDGTPIYNLAVVSDDIAMRITLVMRGDDHISNTPKQILLYRALGHELPAFAHVPMIHGLDGKKLSKRHGATAVGDYADLGILPEALFNFLALLGWNPGDEREVMAKDELVGAFTLERINKKAAIFDTEKLEWMNGQYLAHVPAAELLPAVGPQLVADGLVTQAELDAAPEWLLTTVDLLKTRSRTVLEIAPKAVRLLAASIDYDESATAKHWKDPQTGERLAGLRPVFAALEPWTPEAVEAALREQAERFGVGMGKIAQPLRVALTGSAASPGIDQTVWVMGRERTLARIDAALARLGAPA